MGLLSKYGVSAASEPTLIVPDLAALGALNDFPLRSGTRVRVMSLLDDFELLKTSTTPLAPFVVIATLTGTGRWIRRLCGNFGAWMAQAQWRIDFAAGNDENPGGFAAPLATWAELMRRFGGQVGVCNHTVSKVIRVTSLGATDAMNFDFTCDPGITVNIIGDLTLAFTGVVTARTNLSDVAPGTMSQISAGWTAAQLARLFRDVTNNRWFFPHFDLGAGSLETGPNCNIDTVNGSTTITTGDTTIGATLEGYTLPVVTAPSNLSVSNVKTAQQICVVVQNLDFQGQRTSMRGSKLVLQNCKVASVRYCSGPVVLNNCYHINGSPFDTSEVGQIIVNGGSWVAGFGNNSAPPGCLIDVRNNVCFSGAQILMNRRGVLRLRNMFSMRLGGGANIALLDGAMAFLDNSTLCGTGNGGSNFYLGANSVVELKNGTAVAQCRLDGAATRISMNGLGTCNAFDRATGLYTAPINLTYANIDAAIGVGGFGGQAMDPANGATFQVIAL